MVLVVLLMLLNDSFMFWMPIGTQAVMLVVVAVLICIWAGFVMYETAEDERESFHKMQAGRISYLSGIAVLTVALLVQGYTHTIDPWITTALSVMVVSKLFARLYLERYE